MTQPRPSPHPFRVRLPILLVFVVALGTALMVPTYEFWTTWQTPVVAQVTLTPAHPQTGQAVQLVVNLYPETIALVHGTPLEVGLLMVGMEMGIPTQRVAVAGTQYQAILPFTMSGTWHIHLDLHPTAHAEWQQMLVVQVQHGKVVHWSLANVGGTT
jgi:hypothetical protein